MKTNILTKILVVAVMLSVSGCATFLARYPACFPTASNTKWCYFDRSQHPGTAQHTQHETIFGKYVTGYNDIVLKAIDIVQAHAMDGGGYFIGISTIPTESPVGYPLKLFGMPLIVPPRTSSYCSGSTYTALIETMNLIFPDGDKKISLERFESMRMQEPDGGRRDDNIKFWGYWNTDGYGSQNALVQYSKMGIEIKPEDALPGDFMNIDWASGGGHSVIFLGWLKNDQGEKGVIYWSSQPGTNGYGDVLMDTLKSIRKVKITRLTNPENIFRFDIKQRVKRKIPGDTIAKEW